MSSSSSRRDRQRGSSIVEALVATALLGITATVAVTGWGTAVLGANHALHEAWARCAARVQMEAVLAAPWDGSRIPSYPSVSDRRVEVLVAPAAIGVTGAVGRPVTPSLQQVTVTVTDKETSTHYTLVALKAPALSGSVPVSAKSGLSGCAHP